MSANYNTHSIVLGILTKNRLRQNQNVERKRRSQQTRRNPIIEKLS